MIRWSVTSALRITALSLLLLAQNGCERQPTQASALKAGDAHVPAPAPNPAPPRTTSSAAPVVRAPTTPPSPARTPEACRACNGEWGQHGLSQEPSCLCRTRDHGRACLDGSECEGDCLFAGDPPRVIETGPPRRGYHVGRCSEFVTSFGCHPLLIDGTKQQPPTDLSEEVPTLCID